MAVTISGTDGIVGAGFTVDASGISVTAGVVTATSINANASGLTGELPAGINIPAAQLVGICTAGLTKTGGFGKILQVKQSVKTDTFSTNAYLTVTDIGLSQTITPSSSDSKILIIANIHYGGVGNNYAGIMLFDDSTGSMSPTYRADA